MRKCIRWRRARDSNPRYGSPYTPLAGVRLQPLGQLSKYKLLSCNEHYSCIIMAHVRVTKYFLYFALRAALRALWFAPGKPVQPLGQLS